MAQRRGCEAYILSQREQAGQSYGAIDDGGFSGGNVDRPALKRLLAAASRTDRLRCRI